MRHISTILSDLFQDADFVLSQSTSHEVRHSALPYTGVLSGYSDLDYHLAGFQRSDLIVLTGVSQVGKTSLALGIAYGAAIHHKKSVGYFSLQSDTVQIVRRLIAVEAGVEVSRVAGGDLNDNEWERISRAFGRLAESPLYAHDDSTMSVSSIRVEIQRLKYEHGLDLVIIDDMQSLTGQINLQSPNRQDNLIRDLKAMAKDFSIPVLLISQIPTRHGIKAIPIHLKSIDCEAIEEVADVVLLLQREELYEEDSEKRGIADLQVVKHRHGPLGTVKLRFFDRTVRFADLELYPGPGM